MSFFSDLQNTANQKSAVPKKKTPEQMVLENYEANLDYMFNCLLDTCKMYSQKGQRQCILYNNITYDEDRQKYRSCWTGWDPKDRLHNLHNNWLPTLDFTKKNSPPEKRSDKNALIHSIADGAFPTQSKLLRDRLLLDLKIKLLAEGFPVDCLSPMELPIMLPYSYNYIIGQHRDFRQVFICYYIKFSVSW